MVPTSINNIPIIGDGEGAETSIAISSEGKVVDISITNRGSGYSYGTLDISNVTPLESELQHWQILIL